MEKKISCEHCQDTYILEIKSETYNLNIRMRCHFCNPSLFHRNHDSLYKLILEMKDPYQEALVKYHFKKLFQIRYQKNRRIKS